MRVLLFLLLVIFMLPSCKKRKEIKEWKQKAGNYVTETAYVLFQDSTKTLEAKEIQITASGFTCYGANGAGVNFGVFHKDENPNKNYEYKCQYSSISNYVFGGQGVSNVQIPFGEFTQGREFYLTFSGTKLTFTVIKPDGTIDNVIYNKQ